MNSGLTKNKRSIFFCHLQVRIPIAGMTLFHFRDFTDQGSIREEETLAVFIKGCIREIRYWIILERAGKQKSRRVLRDDKIYLWPTNLRSQACWVAKMVLQRNSSWGGLWKIPFLCVTFSVGPLPSFFWKARSCCWLTGSILSSGWNPLATFCPAHLLGSCNFLNYLISIAILENWLHINNPDFWLLFKSRKHIH